MAKDANVNVRVSTDQKDRLTRLAENEDRSVAQVVRQAIESYLAGKGAK